jgi:hypothetical protein
MPPPIPHDDTTGLVDSLKEVFEQINDSTAMQLDSLMHQINHLQQGAGFPQDTIDNGFLTEIGDGDVDQSDLLLIDAMFLFIICGLIGFLIYRLIRSNWPRIRGKYFYRDYVILIGFTRITSRIAGDMCAKGRKVVVVVKGSARAEADILKKRGAIVMSSEEIDTRILTHAGIRNASTCIVSTGSDSENLAIVDLLKEIKHHVFQSTKLRILVHLENAKSKGIMLDFMPPGNKQGSAEVVAFNEKIQAAQLMYDQHPPYRYLKGESRPDKKEYICIVGYNQVTLFFLRELSVLHQQDNMKRLCIFLVARNVKAVMDELHYTYPFHEQILNIIPVELSNGLFAEEGVKWDNGFMESIPAIDAIYCFGDDDSEVFLTAQHFHQLLWNKTGRVQRVPVTICLPEETRLNSMMSSDDVHGKLTFPAEEINFHFVRMVTDTCTVKNLIENSAQSNQLAMVVNYFESIHTVFAEVMKERFRQNLTMPMLQEIENAFIRFRPKTNDPVRELENTILGIILAKITVSEHHARTHLGISELWESLTERRKQSCRYLVRHIDQKLDYLEKKVIINGVEETKEHKTARLLPLEHYRWLNEKRCTGFRFGQLPDDEKPLRNLLLYTMKIDNNMVPFDQLSTAGKKRVEDMFQVLPPLLAIRDSMNRQP